MSEPRCILRAESGREFAAFAVAVYAFVMRTPDDVLLLRRRGARDWEVPSGALETGETPLAGLARELREELGPAVQYRVLGPVHAGAFAFDRSIPNMISIGFAVEYLGGEIQPGDDMAGAEWAWMSGDEVAAREDVAVPADRALFRRAAELMRHLRI